MDDIDHMNDRVDAAMRLEADRRKRKEFLEKAEKLRFLAEAEEIKLEAAKATAIRALQNEGRGGFSSSVWEQILHAFESNVFSLKEAAGEYERMALSR